MARALSPVVGTALLVACVVAMAAIVGTMALAGGPPHPASAVLVGATADAETNEVVLTLERGGPLDVRALTVVIEVEGEPLEKQPTVPAYSQTGFLGFPSGPFNASADPSWERGRSAGLRIAETNDPLPEPGSRVTVRLFENDLPIAVVETTAR